MADLAEPEVIDWRAPIASVYYDAALGDVSYSVKGEGRFDITLSRKRTYEIEQNQLKDFYDSDVVANDELLTKYLARNKRAVLGEIIDCVTMENKLTHEKLYGMKLLCNNIQFDVCINEKDLLGEPAIGRRFRGNVWMQGNLCLE